MRFVYISVLLVWATLAAEAAVVDIDGGSLVLHGSVSAGLVHVGASAQLGGSGTLNADVTVDGSVSPGITNTGAGIITVTGDCLFKRGSTFECDVFSDSSADLLVASSVAGICSVLIARAGSAIPIELPIINGGASDTYDDFSLPPLQSSWQLTPQSGSLLLTDLVGDSDGDQMSDWWESKYFGGRTNGLASVDSDSDGADNLAEYRAGTDPQNSGSRFVIVSVVTSNSAPVVTWSSVENRNYILSRATNLPGVFTVIASNITATPPRNSYIDAAATGGKVFYRIETRLPY